MTEKSFLEILSEKIEEQLRVDISKEKTPSNNQTYEHRMGPNQKSAAQAIPQWINQIPLGKIHFSTPKEQIFGRAYPKTFIQKAGMKKTQKPFPLREKHNLSEIQKQAVIYFWGWQIRLQEDFTAQELKKAFRNLAQRLHPDRNDGKTQAFLELKMHYQCLLSVFTKPQSS